MAKLSQAVIPKLKNKLLTEHKALIHSLFIENDIDSLKIGIISYNEVDTLVADRVRIQKLRKPICKMFQILKQIMVKKGVSFMNWDNVVNAVSHEMDDVIANDIASFTSTLGDFNGGSSYKLVDEIKSKMKRKLTVSEIDYLRALIQRTTAMDYAKS